MNSQRRNCFEGLAAQMPWVFPLALLAATLALLVSGSQAQTVTITSIHDLGTVSGDPINPRWVGLIAQGRDGNMYSTTPSGGSSGSAGTAFKITPKGTLKVLHDFTSTEGTPLSGLVLGTDGNFWGTTYNGGHSGCNNNQGCGQIFKMTPAGKVTFLYAFTGGNDGGNPTAPPIEASNGLFYGTTQLGGLHGDGTVYEITESGVFDPNQWGFSFDASDGDQPLGALVQATDGTLYGTTTVGSTNCNGYNACATIFSVTTGGTFNELFSFQFGWDQIFNGLVQAYDGTLWGTISNGGTHGCGEVYKITTKGTFKFTDAYDFTGGSNNGCNPEAGLLLGTDGNLYGVTVNGGQDQAGTFFGFTEKGQFIVFKGAPYFNGNNGAYPSVTLMQHTNGTVYADANQGGRANSGTFYKVTGLPMEKTPFVKLLPTEGKIGATIGILGQGFTKTGMSVSFNSSSATYVYVSPTFITATVPDNATTGFVTVTEGKSQLKSNTKFRVTKNSSQLSDAGISSNTAVPPFKHRTCVTLLPSAGTVGAKIGIQGGGFTTTTGVSFNGTNAQFTVDSDTEITAVVPAGATAGYVSVFWGPKAWDLSCTEFQVK